MYSRFDRLIRAGQREASAFRYNEALSYFEKALECRPGDARAGLHHGLCLSELRRYDEARAAMERSRAAAPGRAVFSLFLGLVHLDHGRPSEAETAFEAAISEDKDNTLARNGLALARWDAGDLTDAIGRIGSLDFLQAPPFESRLLLRIEEARKGPAPKVSLPPEKAFTPSWLSRMRRRRVRRWLAKAARQAGNEGFKARLYLLEKIADEEHEWPDLRQALAGARKTLIRDLRKALKKPGSDQDLRLDLGCLLYDERAFDEAEKELQAWLEGLDADKPDIPGAVTALCTLAEIALVKDDPKRAESRLLAHESIKPLEGYALYIKGCAELLQGDRFSARRAFERFLDKDPAFARRRLRAWVEGGREIP